MTTYQRIGIYVLVGTLSLLITLLAAGSARMYSNMSKNIEDLKRDNIDMFSMLINDTYMTIQSYDSVTNMLVVLARIEISPGPVPLRLILPDDVEIGKFEMYTSGGHIVGMSDRTIATRSELLPGITARGVIRPLPDGQLSLLALTIARSVPR